MAGLLLALGFCWGNQAQGALYWGEDAGISRANVDRSVLESPFIRPAYAACALAVDSTHVYWTDSQENKIRRAKLDGTAVESEFIPSAGMTPCDLAVDADHVYWVNKRFDTIGRAKLDGSNVEPDFLPAQEGRCGVAVSPSAIYWTNEVEGRIWAVNVTGSSPPRAIVDGPPGLCDIALTDRNLFWANRDQGTVGRANLDGSAALTLFSAPSYVANIAIESNHLYWVGSQSGIGSIGRASLDGIQVDPAFLSNLNHPFALAADSLRAPPPIVTPPEPSKFRLGKLHRNKKNGRVTFPIDLYENGWLRVMAGGTRVTLLSEGAAESGLLEAGRKSILISPTTKRGDGSRCVLRVFREGGKVKLTLRLSFIHPGKASSEETRSFVLFNPRARARIQPKHRRPPVTCAASPS